MNFRSLAAARDEAFRLNGLNRPGMLYVATEHEDGWVGICAYKNSEFVGYVDPDSEQKELRLD